MDGLHAAALVDGDIDDDGTVLHRAHHVARDKFRCGCARHQYGADQQVRARGTLGGSLANNDPAACYPAAVLALKASIRTDRRSIAADEFFTGIYQTALEPEEIIESVRFAQPLAAAYIKFRQPASHYALVGVFVARFTEGVRVAVTGSAACAFRVPALEQALSASWSVAAARGVKVNASDLNADLHASAEYRAHLIPVLASRAVVAAR
jgi:carbon-monoxide dehydrogenase medium subunit